MSRSINQQLAAFTVVRGLLSSSCAVAIVVALLFVYSSVATATEYVTLTLSEFVILSDAIAIVQVVAPATGTVTVERVMKGELPKQITLVDYIDGFAAPAYRRPLIDRNRELVFLKRVGNDYAPVQAQNGRWDVQGDRVTVTSPGSLFVLNRPTGPRDLSALVRSITRIVDASSKATTGGASAEAVYLSALESADSDLQEWALMTAFRRLDTPSVSLRRAFVGYWPRAKPLVANAIVKWRIVDAAPVVNDTLMRGENEERAWAAFALGGTGNLSYLSILRQTARSDSYAVARAWAYEGIRYMLGPESLPDLKAGARDEDDQVRSQVVVSAYNLLEFDEPRPRWPPASDTLVSEVRAFITQMQSDSSKRVADNARSMLAYIARRGHR